jgi:putative nucleotidyltransferase with HDIG domain
MQIADQLMQLYPELPLNRDVLVAGALLHDVGKPLEYSADNQRRWEQAPRTEGWPPTRHSVNGWHVCLSVGLPLRVAHIPAAHSREGELVVRSLECTIVHYADHAYWNILKAGGMLQDSDAKWVQDPSRAGKS